MFVSKVRPDGVFDGLVEFPDGTVRIPTGHSFSLPPEIPPGCYAVMSGGWKIVKGDKPVYPPIPLRGDLINALETESMKRTQDRLDSFAQTRGYNSILSACTYVFSAVDQYKEEGADCVRLRDETWKKFFEIFNDLRNNPNQAVPASYFEIEIQLPELVWSTSR